MTFTRFCQTNGPFVYKTRPNLVVTQLRKSLKPAFLLAHCSMKVARAIPHSSQQMIQNILSNDSPLREHSANLSYPWVGHQVLPACALKFVGHIHAVVLGVATDRSIPSTFLLNALEYLATLEESLLANLKSKKYCFTNRN